MTDLTHYNIADQHIRSSFPHVKGAPYDLKARYYEKLVGTKLFNRFFWGTTPDDYKAFAKDAIVGSGKEILDIGCGGLAQTAQLYLSTDNNCTLADRSVGMLKVARQRLMEKTGAMPSNIQLLQTDAFHLPFADHTFDTICSFGTIHLFDNKQEFVNETLRVLKKGGRFYYLSMTSQTLISNLFMSALRWFNEFGIVCSAEETVALFDNDALKVNSYMKGSVVFISGEKIL